VAGKQRLLGLFLARYPNEVFSFNRWESDAKASSRSLQVVASKPSYFMTLIHFSMVLTSQISFGYEQLIVVECGKIAFPFFAYL
jgi:hypothetical protein